MNRFGAIAIAVAMSVGSQAHAVQVFFDDFEAETIAGNFGTFGMPGPDGAELTQWTIAQGNVDVVSAAAFPCVGTQCIDVDGTGSADALIMLTKQTFSANVGDEVFISFTYLGIEDSLGAAPGDFDPFFLRFGGMGTGLTMDLFSPQSFTTGPFIVNAPIVNQPLILEVDETPNNFGPFIDNIGLEIRPATTTGEPSLLLLGGLAGLLGLRAARRG